uniref:Uncharacterized protein n=1 Tax=Meloidogyne enterolobii TaxID=390850 RepID=A0A6V7Y282_MELEN|nr:unnamed protein product [Meloidogyne enterolobii]
MLKALSNVANLLSCMTFQCSRSNEWKEFKIANPTLAHKMLEMLAVDG